MRGVGLLETGNRCCHRHRGDTVIASEPESHPILGNVPERGCKPRFEIIHEGNIVLEDQDRLQVLLAYVSDQARKGPPQSQRARVNATQTNRKRTSQFVSIDRGNSFDLNGDAFELLRDFFPTV